MAESNKIKGEVTEMHLDSDNPYLVVLIDEDDLDNGGLYANIYVPESILEDVEYFVSEGHQVIVWGKEKSSMYRKKILMTKMQDLTEDELITQ